MESEIPSAQDTSWEQRVHVGVMLSHWAHGHELEVRPSWDGKQRGVPQERSVLGPLGVDLRRERGSMFAPRCTKLALIGE